MPIIELQNRERNYIYTNPNNAKEQIDYKIINKK